MTTNYPIAMDAINPSVEFYDEVFEMATEADEYLAGFKWCAAIKEKQLYYNLGTTLCVFLVAVENIQSDDPGDNLLWVIVGDLPSMYLDTYEIKSLKEALETYVELGEDWADRILAKKSLKDCFPFDDKPGKPLAIALKSRVQFIREQLLEQVVDLPIGKFK